MPVKPALTELPIETADIGFYSGISRIVTVCSKLLFGGLIVWAIGLPEQYGAVLNGINRFILSSFGAWTIWTVTLFVLVCIGVGMLTWAGSSGAPPRRSVI